MVCVCLSCLFRSQLGFMSPMLFPSWFRYIVGSGVELIKTHTHTHRWYNQMEQVGLGWSRRNEWKRNKGVLVLSGTGRNLILWVFILAGTKWNKKQVQPNLWTCSKVGLSGRETFHKHPSTYKFKSAQRGPTCASSCMCVRLSFFPSQQTRHYSRCNVTLCLYHIYTNLARCVGAFTQALFPAQQCSVLQYMCKPP